MAVAIVLGIISGALGFAPLVVGLRLTKRTTATSSFGPMAILLIALVISFALVLTCAIAFATWDKPNGFPFVLAEVVALATTAIAFGIVDRRKHEERE